MSGPDAHKGILLKARPLILGSPGFKASPEPQGLESEYMGAILIAEQRANDRYCIEEPESVMRQETTPEEILAISSSENVLDFDRFLRDRDRTYDDLLDAADPYVPSKAAGEFRGDIKPFKPSIKSSLEKVSSK